MATTKNTKPKTTTPKDTAKAPKEQKKEAPKAQEQQAPKTAPVPPISVRIDRLVDYENTPVKAIASANIGPHFAIHGMKVISNDKGTFVSMPSTSYEKDGNKVYQDTFHPVSSEGRKALNEAVLKAYEQKLEQEQTEQSEVQSEDEAQDMDEEPAEPVQSM